MFDRTLRAKIAKEAARAWANDELVIGVGFALVVVVFVAAVIHVVALLP